MTEQTLEELSTEVETLRNLKADLHKNLTEARGRIRELEAAGTEVAAEVDRLRAEVMDLRLHKPVAGLLDSILVGSKYSAQELADHYRFELSDSGEIEMRDPEGKAALVTEKVEGKESTRPVRFEAQDVRRFLESTGNFDHILRASGATGSGAPANYSPGNSGNGDKAPERKGPSTGFGLK
jgi:chromosome segregation ATPase